MTGGSLHTAHRLFAAMFLFGASHPPVGRFFRTPEQPLLQQEASHHVGQRAPMWPSQHRSRGDPVFFAAAFTVPAASPLSGRMGVLHPAATLCGNVNSQKNHSCLSCGGVASASCATRKNRLGKEGTWRLRASTATSAAAAPTPVLLSGVKSFRTARMFATAASAGPGGASTTCAVTETAAASDRATGTASPSTGALHALPGLHVAGEKPTPTEAPVYRTPAEAGSAASKKGTSRTAAAASEGAPEKTVGAAAPLGPVVTRKDLVASLTAELQLPRADVERTIAALLRHITANLEVGRKVSISKFGSFSVRRRGERTARNPRTGETLSVAAATFPTFAFSKVLKERVRDVVPINDEDGNEEAEGKDEEQS